MGKRTIIVHWSEVDCVQYKRGNGLSDKCPRAWDESRIMDIMGYYNCDHDGEIHEGYYRISEDSLDAEYLGKVAPND